MSISDTPAAIARLKAYVDDCDEHNDLNYPGKRYALLTTSHRGERLYLTDIRAALGEIERLRGEIVPLAHMVDNALELAGEGCDYDGGNIQEDAIALGLIVAGDMTPEEAAEHGYDDGSSWMDETPLCKSALFCVRGWPLPTPPVSA